MKKKLFLAMASTLAIGGGFSSTQALAATSSDDAELKKILLQEQKLEQQVQYLNQEVVELKREKAASRRPVTANPYIASKPVPEGTGVISKAGGASTTSAPVPQTNSATVWTSAPPPELISSKRTGRYPSQILYQTPEQIAGHRLANGLSVTTSPYLGLRSAFDASDLVSNISTMNEDLRLLQQRQTVTKAIIDAGESPSFLDRPLMILSGNITAQASSEKPFQGPTANGLDLTNAEFDVLSYVSSWATGLISMGYDNGPFPNVTLNGISTSTAQLVGAGQRVANSRFFLKRGFLTIGDLAKFPFYFTAGQMYAPFGTYTTQLLDSTLPQSIGQTDERTALIGFYKDGLYGSGYIFNGETRSVNSDRTSTLDNGGANLGLKHSFKDDVAINIGAGFLGNIADSLGLQLTNAPSGFQGFGFSSTTEIIQHPVSATDLHAELDVKKLSLIGEFINSNKSFDPLDLSYNGSGARPAGLHVEGDYTFKIINWPSVFTLAYGRSWQALGLSLPRNSYIAMVTTSIWKDTIEAIEFRHDQNYSTSDIAGGNNTFAPTSAGEFLPVLPGPVASVGGSQNTVTGSIGVYF